MKTHFKCTATVWHCYLETYSPLLILNFRFHFHVFPRPLLVSFLFCALGNRTDTVNLTDKLAWLILALILPTTSARYNTMHCLPAAPFAPFICNFLLGPNFCQTLSSLKRPSLSLTLLWSNVYVTTSAFIISPWFGSKWLDWFSLKAQKVFLSATKSIFRRSIFLYLKCSAFAGWWIYLKLYRTGAKLITIKTTYSKDKDKSREGNK